MESYRKKARETGLVIFFAGLTRRQKSILSEGGWDSGAFDDEVGVGGNATDIGGTFQDPAVYVR